MATVVVFPGQGSQRAGMAQDFVEHFPEAVEVFAEASSALGWDVARLCFDEPERLGLTAYTQPAILTAEIAIYRTLVVRFGLCATHFGGHSLGEYTALVAAGVVPLDEAVRLVHERGRRMQEVVPAGEGAMAAVSQRGLELAELEAALAGLQVDLANHNSPDQAVISGASDDVDQAIERLADGPLARARVRRLDVSAPFHSRMMRPMVAPFTSSLEASAVRWEPGAAAGVVSNLSGGFHLPERAAIVAALAGQIPGRVRWVDNMRALQALAPEAIYELGPSRPLRGLFRTIGVTVTAITNVRMAERALLEE